MKTVHNLIVLVFVVIVGFSSSSAAGPLDTGHGRNPLPQGNYHKGIDNGDGVASLNPFYPLNKSNTSPFLNSASEHQNPHVDKAAFAQKTKKLQIPFIANNGQVDERVKFYANTFGGTVFVTNDGEIVYALPKSDDAEGGEIHRKDSRLGEAERTQHGRPEDEIHRKAAKSAKERTEGGMDKQSLSMPPTAGRAGAGCPPLAGAEGVDGNFDGSASLDPSYTDHPVSHSPKITGIALREHLVGASIGEVRGEGRAETRVNYFKGNDPEKWKTDVSTYDMVNLGEVYEGIDLKLKAYGDNVEKLFCVKPGADPEQIKVGLSGIQPTGNSPQPCRVGTAHRNILGENSPQRHRDTEERIDGGTAVGTNGRLSPDGNVDESIFGGQCPPYIAESPLEKGARGLWVNEHGQLVAETELGPVKFTKPVAYQEIDGKRVEVEVMYEIHDAGGTTQTSHSNSLQRETNRKAKTLIRTIIEETIPNWRVATNDFVSFLSEVQEEENSPNTINPRSKIRNPKFEYGFKVASYDKTKNLIIDPLLASTLLGGSKDDNYVSIAIDTSGNVYVAGATESSDFPTTTGAYDISSSSSGDYDYDIFVSKLNSDLTGLVASTFLGGVSTEEAFAIGVDAGGNVYVTGRTWSKDFPVTTGAYDTSYYSTKNGLCDIFISKLNSDLKNLLASTFLGGSDEEEALSIAIDASGNVCMAGYTDSTDFPTTAGAYDTYGGYDAFVSKLNSDLTGLVR